MPNNASQQQETYARLYLESFDSVYAFVVSRCAGDRRMAEEIVQDAFTAAWVSFDRFHGESSFQTWVCSIARNKLNESYRKAIRREAFEFPADDALEQIAADVPLETEVLAHETQNDVQRALQSLRAPYRYVLILRYLDCCSIAQIARAMRRTPKAIDGLLQRAKAAFERVYTKLEV
ncbi:MAG: RNA polymerase sigma factor [Christensenella sp.]|nr:RNA polymerase sigma factor [Christensenella sp.]